MSQNERVPAYLDPNQSEEARIDSLIAALTLDEKIACLGTNPSAPRLGLRFSGHVEGLHGLAMGGPAEWGGKGTTVPTTTFPQSYGLGETWDPDLVRRVAEAESVECRYLFHSPKYRRAGLVVRAPNADLGRDPRWGRTEECFGEDAFLTATLTVAFVKGLQGDHPKYWRTASLMKHFLANSHERDRERTSSNFDETLWREYYSFPFMKGVTVGGSRAFMAAYNAYNGVPCHVHPMLEEICRRQWGNDGIICTDGGGLRLLVTGHKWYVDLPSAAAACVKAGINQFLDDYKGAVADALDRGLLAEADVERVIRGPLRVMLRLGLLDPEDDVPYTRLGRGKEPWLRMRHRSLARTAAEKSIVLLKNQGALLPLAPERIRSIAVLGPRSDEVLLDWYSGTPPYAVTALDGIRRRLGSSVKVQHDAGNDPARAADLARQADVAIVCVGNHVTGNAGWAKVTYRSDGKEAVDRRSIRLEDEAMVKAVLQANPRTVLTLIASFPYAIGWSQRHVPAILHMAHGGQEMGTALAGALFGDVNPAGRLTQTWPKAMRQLPPMLDYDLRHGRTYPYFRGRPLYAFGHGLGYSRFAYSKLSFSSPTITRGGSIDVTLRLRNLSERDGEEVVQLYVRRPDAGEDAPRRQLKAFRRLLVKAGRSKRVRLTLSADSLSTWNVDRQRFVLEPGTVEVMVGASSSDIRLRGDVQAV